jgi:hypothetical protein
VSPVKYELGFYIPEDDILHSHRRENLKSYRRRVCFRAVRCSATRVGKAERVVCVVLWWSAVVDSSYGMQRISLPEGITYHNITPLRFLFVYTLIPNNTECFRSHASSKSSIWHLSYAFSVR